jgi:hypothetical protein
MNKPWDKEPTIWKRFCEEVNLPDDKPFRELYSVSTMLQDKYKWFALGFYCGGQS